LRLENALLTGDHHHGHGAKQGKGRARRQVERAWAERGETDAGPAGQPAMRRRHEGCRLFMAGHHQLDGGASERLDDIEVLFAGNPEDLPDALVLQCGYQQFGTVHRMQSSSRSACGGGIAGREAGSSGHG
jgi:hypothetical protein